MAAKRKDGFYDNDFDAATVTPYSRAQWTLLENQPSNSHARWGIGIQTREEVLRESLTEKDTDAWYASRAVFAFVALGGVLQDNTVVKLIHPEGRGNLATQGMVLVETQIDDYHCERLCVIFPGQLVRQHQHEKVVDAYKIVLGSIMVSGFEPVRGNWIMQGKDCAECLTLLPAYWYQLGTSHGAVFMGTSCIDYQHDVAWMDYPSGPIVLPAEDRVTVLPIVKLYGMATEAMLMAALPCWKDCRIPYGTVSSFRGHLDDAMTAEMAASKK